MDSGQLVNTINSNLSKLRRPAGMIAFTKPQNTATTDVCEMAKCLSYYVLVTDIAANVVIKYQFF